jgi:hypothetical protein
VFDVLPNVAVRRQPVTPPGDEHDTTSSVPPGVVPT